MRVERDVVRRVTYVTADDGRVYMLTDRALVEADTARHYLYVRYGHMKSDRELVEHMLREFGIELLVGRGTLEPVDESEAQ